jgi:antitoxin ParD1/3/4
LAKSGGEGRATVADAPDTGRSLEKFTKFDEDSNLCRQRMWQASLAPVKIFYYIVDKESMMPKPTTLNVRVGGVLSEFVASNVGSTGSYDNASEYVRDLIRKDKDRMEFQAFERLKAELQRAFATPESDYRAVTADEVIKRNRARRARP